MSVTLNREHGTVALRNLPESQKKKLIAKFESRIYYGLDGCWHWLGGVDSHGERGRFWAAKRTWIAPRAGYELLVGPIPDNLFVCHHCDNPSCVNPDHLFLGTNADNVNDYVRKGFRTYSIKGEKNRYAKLTSDQVIEIRELRGSKTLTEIGKQFNIGPSAVSMIHNRKTWAHI
jgi:hypothetical protein